MTTLHNVILVAHRISTRNAKRPIAIITRTGTDDVLLLYLYCMTGTSPLSTESKDITIAILKSIALFQIDTRSLKIVARYILTELSNP